MPWISSFPKIANKDTEPDLRWTNIVEKISNIFDDNIIVPPEYSKYTFRQLTKIISEYFEDYEVNFNKIKLLDFSKTAENLLKLLRPGRTSTVLMEGHLIDELKRNYNGVKDGLFVKFILNYINENGSPDQFRVFPKEYYKEMLSIIESFSSGSVYKYLISEIMDKVELASFCKGGDRRARWMLDPIHPEYGNSEECHRVAAKLSYFLIDFIDDDLLRKNKVEKYQNKIHEAKEECFKLFNEVEKKFIEEILPKAVCPMCLSKIHLNDFFRNGRNDELSVVFGHYSFRGNRDQTAHQGKNAFWLHRTCNYIQGEYTIEERVKTLKEIVSKHNSLIIDWEKRG
jgi:hypothetical protein